MLKTIPRHWFTWNCKVLENDTPVASIEFAAWAEAGEIIIHGSRYRVYREFPYSRKFFLEENGQQIAWAEKPSVFRVFDVKYTQIEYELKAESIFKNFILQQDRQIIGSINPENPFTRRTSVDLPESLPLVVRLFMVWLVLNLRRRQSRRANAANTRSACN
ncbi:hypothetical protein BZZ01_11670 [Nostocales cyanobacterium HT-58-2]|nr:hypothetical protein BZZ01_11670 [Nostocales cyanobacterium HT-58-2]